MKIRHVARIAVSNVDKKSADGEQPVRLCNYVDVYNNQRITPDLSFMPATASQEQVRQFHLHEGDVVITKDSETPDDIGVPAFVTSDIPGLVCGYHLAIVRPNVSLLDGRYLYWAIKASTTQAQFSATASGITRFGLRHEAIGSTEVPLPSLPSQRAIANFLDAETARIDSVIEKRQALIVREAERFQSVVFSLVCGFDVEDQRRSSRLAWVSTLPKSWEVRKLAWDYEIQLGKMLNPKAASGLDQRPYLANRDVQWDRIEVDGLGEMSFTDDERLRLRLRSGDLLVCEGGEVGRAAMWKDELTECYYQKAIHRLRPRRSAFPRFLMYCLWAAASRGVFAVEGNTSTVVHLTAEQLAAHRFPFPSVEEQASIVSALDQANHRWRRATDRMTRQIELLNERRQSLITATVNAQIPVPGVAA
jgi:type I restriction enzyme S subunit